MSSVVWFWGYFPCLTFKIKLANFLMLYTTQVIQITVILKAKRKLYILQVYVYISLYYEFIVQIMVLVFIIFILYPLLEALI